ncbi:MAG TPA: SWIM zinc finger family protein, partial [Thermodesulfobacteriota bacterium]|nr:SWIM zinc finger family protein [Thermodesulfobacteriota bacterium]
MRNPPLPLSILVQKSVPSNIRRKGEVYHRMGSVRGLRGDSLYAEAKVHGTRPYDTSIYYHRDDRTLEGTCSCPYFEQNGVCKHVWAVLLASEGKGLLSAAAEDRCNVLIDAFDEDLPPEEEEYESLDFKDEPLRRGGNPRREFKRAAPRPPSWKQHFDALGKEFIPRQNPPWTTLSRWPADRRVLYTIDAGESSCASALPVGISFQDRKKNGEWGKSRFISVRCADLDLLPDALDRRILTVLAGAGNDSYYWGYSGRFNDSPDPDFYRTLASRYLLSARLCHEVIPLMCATGRLLMRRATERDGDHASPVAWDDKPAWEFGIDVSPYGPDYCLTGHFRRGDESLPMSAAVLITRVLVFTGGAAARMECGGGFGWLMYLRRHGSIRVPREESGAMLERLFMMPARPPLRLPAELEIHETRIAPKPMLKVHKPRQTFSRSKLPAHFAFDYDGLTVKGDDARPAIFQADRRRLLVRDEGAEEAAVVRLREI